MSPRGWIVAVLLAVVGLSLSIAWGLRTRGIREVNNERWEQEAPPPTPAMEEPTSPAYPSESTVNLEPAHLPEREMANVVSPAVAGSNGQATTQPDEEVVSALTSAEQRVLRSHFPNQFEAPSAAFSASSLPNRLTVLSADGVGLYGATVSLLPSIEAASAIWTGLTDEEGEVNLNEIGTIPPAVAFVVSAPGHMTNGPTPLSSLGVDSAVRLTRAASLTGTVVGPLGSPINDAQVSVQYPGQLDIGQRIEQRSDARGGFRFDELPAGHALVRAEAPGLLGHERWVSIPASGNLRFTLNTNGALAGRVLDRSSRPISGATVTVRASAWRQADEGLTSPTSSDGEFMFEGLEQGTYRIRASHPGYDEGPASDTTLTLHTDVTSVDLILEQRQTTVSGRVFDATSGTPIGGFAVCAEPWVAGTFFDTWSENRPTSVTDHLGRFTLALDAGRWRLAEAAALNVGHQHRALTPIQPVEFDITAGGGLPGGLTLIVAPAIGIEGQVIDPDGNPVPGASVVSEAEGLGLSPPVTTDASGQFRLDRTPLGRSPNEGVNVRLIARHSAWPAVASPQAALHPGDSVEEVTLQMGVGHTVEGTLTDGQTGQPVEGASVTLQDSLTGELLRGTSNREGRFLFERRPPQPHLLTITSANHSTVRRIITPDENLEPLNIRLGSGLSITGRVIDLSGDPVVGVRVEAPLVGRTAYTLPDGRFALSHLEAGPHDITFNEVEPPYRVASRRGVLPGGEAIEVVIGWEDAVVTGTVMNDETESPQTFFAIVINHFDAESGTHLSTRIEYFQNDEGTFEVTLYRPGRHHFAFVAGESPIAEEEFLVTQGGQSFENVEITIPRPNPHVTPGSVTGILEMPEDTDRLLVEAAASSSPVETDGTGAFTLEQLATGTHTLIIHSQGDDGPRLVGYYPNVEVNAEEVRDLGNIPLSAVTPPSEFD